jgi:hypothetical protein
MLHRVRLQDGSGIEATRDIRAKRPQAQVLMLTSFADDEAARSARSWAWPRKTVKSYLSSILTKLEVARRAEAAAYLARHTTTPAPRCLTTASGRAPDAASSVDNERSVRPGHRGWRRRAVPVAQARLDADLVMRRDLR